LSAEDVTISLLVPAGTKVVSATGTGYQGVKREANADVATWRVPKVSPRDQQKYTITLAGTPAAGAVPKGHISWAKPKATEDADVEFTLQQPAAGRGRGAATQ
jgi:hypothetical protein